MNRSKKNPPLSLGAVTFATADAAAPDWDITSAVEIGHNGRMEITVKDDGRGAVAVLPGGRYETEADAAAASLRALSDALYVLQRVHAEAFRAAGL